MEEEWRENIKEYNWFKSVFNTDTRCSVFSNSTVFKLFHSGERFRIDPFSLIVFGIVVWTVAVSGTKQ